MYVAHFRDISDGHVGIKYNRNSHTYMWTLRPNLFDQD